MVLAIFGSMDRGATTTWRQPSPAEISSSPPKWCAKFVTTNKNEEKEGVWEINAFGMDQLNTPAALLLTLDKPVIIGRNPAQW